MTQGISFGRLVLILGALLIAIHSAVFLSGRTLFSIDPMMRSMPNPSPYAFTTTVDSGGAYIVSYAYDAYRRWAFKNEGTLLPLWAPHQGLGQPFLQNTLSAILYPINWLHLILPPIWWDMIYLLNWLLAAVFLGLYLRTLGLNQSFVLLGGALMISNGFFQGHLALREYIAVAAWVPLILYAVERTFREPFWRWRHAVLAFSLYAIITAGQPEATFLGLLMVLIYGFVRLFTLPNRWKLLRALLPGVLAGFLISAPLWLNFLNYAFDAYSAHLSSLEKGLRALHFGNFVQFVFPYFYGQINQIPFLVKPGGWSMFNDPYNSYAIGWFPVLGLFLALCSLAVFRKHRFVIGFFWSVLLLVFAKSFGLPGINLLGALPFFDRLVFPVYSAFLLPLALTILAIFGLQGLLQLKIEQWSRWLILWTGFISLIFAGGLYFIWPALLKNNFWGYSMAHFFIFGGLGLLWAIVGPVGLFLLRRFRPDQPNFVWMTVFLHIVLQGIAYLPHGFSPLTYAVLGIILLFFFINAVLALLFSKKSWHAHPRLPLIVLCLLALPSFFVHGIATYGLPARYDPLQASPYLEFLQKKQGDNRYRSYAIDPLPSPNYSGAFGFSSLSMTTPILPLHEAQFMSRYLDNVDPIHFAGNFWREGEGTALDAFLKHKAYFDLVGVRYLLLGYLEPALKLPLIFSDPAQPVYVWENPQALPRVFLAPKASVEPLNTTALNRLKEISNLGYQVLIDQGPTMESDWPAERPAGKLLSFQLTANDVRVAYEAFTGGILTLTDVYEKGWRATLNGKEVPVLQVNGVFRGIRIDESGVYNIHLWYRPPFWYFSLGMLAAGLILIFLLSLKKRVVMPPINP